MDYDELINYAGTDAILTSHDAIIAWWSLIIA